MSPTERELALMELNRFLVTENQRLTEDNRRLKERLEEAHTTVNGMHDEMVEKGVRQEAFGV